MAFTDVRITAILCPCASKLFQYLTCKCPNVRSQYIQNNTVPIIVTIFQFLQSHEGTGVPNRIKSKIVATL